MPYSSLLACIAVSVEVQSITLFVSQISSAHQILTCPWPYTERASKNRQGGGLLHSKLKHKTVLYMPSIQLVSVVQFLYILDLYFATIPAETIRADSAFFLSPSTWEDAWWCNATLVSKPNSGKEQALHNAWWRQCVWLLVSSQKQTIL